MITHTHRPARRTITRRAIAAIALSIALVSLIAMPARSTADAQQSGAALLARVQNGKTSCGTLSTNDFAVMGEYDMGRIMGSVGAYHAMNTEMRATAGTGGEQIAYRFMGQRLAGCATGTGPIAFGTMMGIMGNSEMGASYGSAYPSGRRGSSMMSDYATSNGGVSVVAVALIVLAVLGVLALIVWLVTRRTPGPPASPRTA